MTIAIKEVRMVVVVAVKLQTAFCIKHIIALLSQTHIETFPIVK